MARVWIFGVVAAMAMLGSARRAAAEEAIVTVGRIDRLPPTQEQEVVRAEDPPIVPDDDPHTLPHRELYRSPFRLQLGPAAVTTGKGAGAGLELAADIGTGAVGARFSAAWMQGEGHSGDPSYPLGTGIGQYTAEATLDLHKRGPLHPVMGIGFGMVHVSRTIGSGTAGIGTGRVGLDYAIPVEEADVRVGVHATGALTGPSDDEIKDLRGYALVAAVVSIGF